MNRKSDTSFRIWCFFMVLFGFLLIALDIMLMMHRFQDPSISRIMTLFSTLILLAAGILEVVSGIRGFIFSNGVSRGRRFRAVSAKMRSFKRFGLFALILSVFQIIFSCLTGIMIWQLALLIAGGVFLPLFYIASAKSLRG